MFYKSQCQCINCNHEFTTTKVNRKVAKIVKTDSDFCVHYENFNPSLYDTIACPECGFAFNKSFRKLSEFYKKPLKEKYLSKVKVVDYCGERSIEDAIRVTQLAYICAKQVNETKMITGNILLKLAWLYRYSGNIENELRFLRLAAQELDKSLTSERLNGGDEGKLIYLIAELNLRGGNYEIARKWFSVLITDKKKYGEQYRTMAVNRWQDYKESQAETTT